jgi:uncharacterized protein with ParB-like and HNH nuclease domain
MRPARDLKYALDLYPQEVSSSVKYFFENNIDWDVYLPNKGINLQRGFVWTLEQKRELIMSILIGRHIPHCAVINVIDPKDNKKEIFQIIDGRQRLSTIKFFLEDNFAIILEGKVYCFSDLPEDYKTVINRFYFRYYVVNEPWDVKITDEQKVNWFKFINFAGTPQDKEHMEKLNNKI